MHEGDYSWNSVSWGMANNLLSLLRTRIPDLSDLALEESKPDIAKNVPDNFYEFIEARRQKNLKVDGYPFEWKDHEYIIEPYKAFQLQGDRSEEGLAVRWMCGAQVGKSIAAMLFTIWVALRFWGKYFGYFLPDQAMAMIFSSIRFKPMCLSVPELINLWGEDPTAITEKGGSKKMSDQKRVRSIGPSQIFFSYMGGVTSTESIPMLSQVRDEVRRMNDSDIERARERLAHSPYPIEFDISTAGYPDVNIDKLFKDSNQKKFHSDCKCGSGDGVVLADVFPECVGQRPISAASKFKNLPPYFWICPKCKEPITNPRIGKWIAHNPSSRNIGYHMPQILSPVQTAEKIFLAFLRASDITEFFNSKLGIAHISKEARLVDKDILRATVNPDLRWKKHGINCAMGVDQMYGFNVVVVRERGPKDLATGIFKSRLIHLEWIVSDDPWKRCAEMMQQFDVRKCVVDALPNANEALRFAKAFRGRVYLADYTYDAKKGEDICVWGDKVEGDPNKKSSQDTKTKFRVRISRFHGIEWNLMRYVKGFKEQPHEKGLVGTVPDAIGREVPTFICEAVFWDHLQRVAKRKIVLDETQDKFKMVFENIGIDPHFLHADVYAELGCSRLSDPDGAAFADYRKAQEEIGDKEHKWVATSNPSHYKCEKCGIMVAVVPGKTAHEVAAQKGFKDCENTQIP